MAPFSTHQVHQGFKLFLGGSRQAAVRQAHRALRASTCRREWLSRSVALGAAQGFARGTALVSALSRPLVGPAFGEARLLRAWQENRCCWSIGGALGWLIEQAEGLSDLSTVGFGRLAPPPTAGWAAASGRRTLEAFLQCTVGVVLMPLCTALWLSLWVGKLGAAMAELALGGALYLLGALSGCVLGAARCVSTRARPVPEDDSYSPGSVTARADAAARRGAAAPLGPQRQPDAVACPG